jgi:beta-glucosidase
MTVDDARSTPASHDGSDLDERLALLAGADTWHTVSAAGVPPVRVSDGPAGVRGTSWTGPPSASFPCGTALAATFDPDLVRAVGRALGREARAKSAHVLLAPTVNLQRTPIGGRNFECMSEDPVHSAVIAVAYIEGVQAERVACCVKHLVGNDTEFNRMTISSEIPERVLREVYLVPFEAAVDAGVRSVMSAYNRLNGTFCSENDWLLRTVLREEWGFDGVVFSDWFGTHSTAPTVRAGLDVEMPGPPRFRSVAQLREAMQRGDVTEPEIDEIVARLATLAEWTGAATTGTDERTLDDPAIRAVSRRAAAAGTVLLRNENLLPLRPGTRIALIGPYAATGRVQGGGSARVRAAEPSALLPALRERGFVVEHAIGCHIEKTLPALRGDFEVTITDVHGESVTEPARRVQFFWQEEPADGLDAEFGARVSGTFLPDVDGEWRIGLRAVGTATVRIDGDVVVALDEPRSGGSFFGYGSEEVVATVELTAGEPCHVDVDLPMAPHPGVRALVVGAAPPERVDRMREAVELAVASDVAVVVVGTDDEWETEGEDRTSMALPGRQDELVAAVSAANPRTVVVVNAGSAVTMPWVADVPAILHLWFPGGQLGVALTDVLSGDSEPGGRLPVTFPRRLADTPAAEHYPGDGERAVYGEGLLVGHRWYDAMGITPLFPFGHGLGYTTFDIEPLGVTGDARTDVVVSARVANTGQRPGSEVVQVYVGRREADGRTEPLRRFAGSRKVWLVPGETATVEITLPARRFESWLDGGWTVVPGPYDVFVGRSSASLLSAGTVEG